MEVASLGIWLRKLEQEHGSIRAAARACGIDAGYWYRMREGEMTNPSDETLARLGLRAVVTLYEKAP